MYSQYNIFAQFHFHIAYKIRPPTKFGFSGAEVDFLLTEAGGQKMYNWLARRERAKANK